MAISLPRSLFSQVERMRNHSGESRSAFIQRVIRFYLESQAHREKVRSYVDGYERNPETEEEIRAAEAAAAYALSEEPWE